jgi:hypothetical protein
MFTKSEGDVEGAGAEYLGTGLRGLSEAVQLSRSLRLHSLSPKLNSMPKLSQRFISNHKIHPVVPLLKFLVHFPDN